MIRALIVEDSPTQAQSLKIVLESEKIEAVIAENGERALDLLGEERFDFVVSDIVMPGLSGYDLCRRIKASPHWRDLPVILLTSLKDPMDIVEGLECGADNFFTKPYDPEQLMGRINHILENRRLRKEGKLKVGVEIAFLGRTITINSEREQILDLLVTTFEDIVRANRALEKSQAELAEAKTEVEKYARLVEAKLDVSEEALRESEALFRSAFDGAGHGMALISTDGQFMRVNPAICRFLGYSEDELLNRDMQSVTHPDDLDQERRQWDRAVSDGGESYRMEKRYVRKDGRAVWGDLTVSPVKDANGNPKHCVSQVQDITAQKEAEEELRHTVRALRVVSRGNQALVHANSEEQLLHDMCRVLVEDGGYRMAWVGFPEDDKQKSFKPVAVHGHHDGYLQAVRSSWGRGKWGRGPAAKAFLSGEPSVCADVADDPDYAPWRREALKRGYRSTVTFPLKESGKPFGVLNIYSSEVGAFHREELEILKESAIDLAFGIVGLRNMQERKRAEAALAESEARLRQSEKMESLGNLAGGIAHDFNNMLLPIQTLTTMTLRDLPEGSPAIKRLERVIEAAGRAGDLVKRILTFSRREETDLQPTDISDVINETLALARSTIPRSILIKDRIGRDVGCVMGDPAQIETALLNLAVNAADAMDARAGTLEVELQRVQFDQAVACSAKTLPPGTYAELTVADSGRGMDEATLRRAFEPFFTTKERGKGTGLGLAMVHGIVTRHGGGVLVSSTSGAGTTFKLYFPIAQPT